MTQAWIGLGANLGRAQHTLLVAVQALREVPGIEVLRLSGCYLSAPVHAGGPDYYNAVAELRSRLPALALLHVLQAIEQAAGRQRPYPNAPRTLDLDLLLYGDLRQDDPELTLPHPRMYQRAFVLLPLAELAPQKVTAQQLAQVAAQRIERLPAWPDGVGLSALGA